MSTKVQVATPSQNGVSLMAVAERQNQFDNKLDAIMQAIGAISAGNAPQPAQVETPAPIATPNNRTRGVSPAKQVAAQTEKKLANAPRLTIEQLRAKVMAGKPEPKETEAQPGVSAIIGGRKYNLRPFETCTKDAQGKYTIPTGRTSISVNGGKTITIETLILYTSDEFRELAGAYIEHFGHLHPME